MTSGLYHKPMMIINEDSRVISKLEASLTDNARVVIYDRHMLIVQAIGQLERSNTNRTYSSQSKCMQPLINVVAILKKRRLWWCTWAGSAKANGREPKSCLGRVFNFKLDCFVVYNCMAYIQVLPSLQWKTRPRFRPVSLSLSMTRAFID
jgi:hypothetical protein